MHWKSRIYSSAHKVALSFSKYPNLNRFLYLDRLYKEDLDKMFGEYIAAKNNM